MVQIGKEGAQALTEALMPANAGPQLPPAQKQLMDVLEQVVTFF
jgi:hypothetical protein